MSQNTDDDLGSDLLYGADEIAAYIRRKPAFVYYAQKSLGLTHVGAILVGSKSKLKKLLTGETVDAA
jgi:hypothetical protein